MNLTSTDPRKGQLNGPPTSLNNSRMSWSIINEATIQQPKKRRRFNKKRHPWEDLPSEPMPLPWDTDRKLRLKLIQAVHEDNADVLRMFNELGMDMQVNTMDPLASGGESHQPFSHHPLIALASSDQTVSLAQWLIEDCQVNVNKIRPYDGMTALMVMLYSRSTEFVNQAFFSLLLHCGVDINVTDKNGCTALFYAAMRNHEVYARLLIERGASADCVDVVGWNILKYAINKPFEQVSLPLVHLLIVSGSHVDHYNSLVQLYLLEVVVQKDNDAFRASASLPKISSESTSYCPLMALLLQFSQRPKKLLERCIYKACNPQMKLLLEQVILNWQTEEGIAL